MHIPSLLEAVEQGLIDEATIDRAVTRLFTARFRLGMFDPPEQVPFTRIPYEVNDSPEHRAPGAAGRARIHRAAQERRLCCRCAARDLKSIAVIGPNADDLAVLLGNYCGTPSHAVTPLEGHPPEGVARDGGVHCPGLRDRGRRAAAVGGPGRLSPPAGRQRGPRLAGLAGTYYSGRTIRTTVLGTDPAFVRVDPLVDFGWRDASPLGGQVTDHFCVRWTGALIPPTSGKYLLGVRGSSGYQLLAGWPRAAAVREQRPPRLHPDGPG